MIVNLSPLCVISIKFVVSLSLSPCWVRLSLSLAVRSRVIDSFHFLSCLFLLNSMWKWNESVHLRLKRLERERESLEFMTIMLWAFWSWKDRKKDRHTLCYTVSFAMLWELREATSVPSHLQIQELVERSGLSPYFLFQSFSPDSRYSQNDTLNLNFVWCRIGGESFWGEEKSLQVMFRPTKRQIQVSRVRMKNIER